MKDLLPVSEGVEGETVLDRECSACGGMGVEALGPACLTGQHMIGCDCQPCDVCNPYPEPCPCCGEVSDCGCLIYDFEGYSNETGPWGEKRCTEHRRRV